MSEVTNCDGCAETIRPGHYRYLELSVEATVRILDDPDGPLHFHDEDCLRKWLGVPFHLDACARSGMPLTAGSRGDEICICLSPSREVTQ